MPQVLVLENMVPPENSFSQVCVIMYLNKGPALISLGSHYSAYLLSVDDSLMDILGLPRSGRNLLPSVLQPHCGVW